MLQNVPKTVSIFNIMSSFEPQCCFSWLFFLPFLSFSFLHCQCICFHLNHHSIPNHIIFSFDLFEDQICKIPTIILLISSFSLILVFQTFPKTITSCSPHLFTSKKCCPTILFTPRQHTTREYQLLERSHFPFQSILSVLFTQQHLQ